jgi:hypothetical protein
MVLGPRGAPASFRDCHSPVFVGCRLDAVEQRCGGSYACGEAEVAQLVEQLIRNQQVDGSSPFLGSTSRPQFFAGALSFQQVVTGWPARSSPILGSTHRPSHSLAST